MKKITQLFLTFLIIIFISESYAQKVAIIGANHLSPDGISFVALENLPSGEVIYFTEDEYNNSTNIFSSGESVTKYIVGSNGLNKGDVVFLKETATDDTLTVTCTSGSNCGTATVIQASFALASSGESLYAYGDSNDTPTDGVTEIYSLFYTGGSSLSLLGGAVPSIMDPSSDFPNAIVTDGFPAVQPNRTEFKTSIADRTNVSKTILENPSSYINEQANADLSTVAFTNLNLFGSNPELTLSTNIISTPENSGTSIVYTFSLPANPSSITMVNFNVSGSAEFGIDYTVSGADTFTTTSGTATIPTTSNSVSVTISPIGDTTLEPDETVVLSITAGSNYDVGNPSEATVTITNDDTGTSTPLVAISGLNHTPDDGFSFVALDDITENTIIYFTENKYNTSLLVFESGESVLQWTAPANVNRGDVFVVTETSSDVFAVSCSDGSGTTCGTITLISGSFATAFSGEEFYAYSDSDTNPANGVDEVYALLYTISGAVPSSENPINIYPNAVIVDDFSSANPNRVEYDPAKKNVTVDQANFQNKLNWIVEGANQTLSVTPFSNIIITSGSANPKVTLTASGTNLVEDGGASILYTFSLDAPASGDVIINFAVSGEAISGIDYSSVGNPASDFTFETTSGTIKIEDGTSSSTISVSAIADTDVEVLEELTLTIDSGAGYDGGSPNAATVTIENDDTSVADPLVAITGLNHLDDDGFSFVALLNISAGTEIYFTDRSYDNTTLKFTGTEAILKWTAPTDVDKGDVVVVSETNTDVFSLSCSDGTGGTCGTLALESGTFSIASGGEAFYAYIDVDNDPNNGVSEIYSVLYSASGTIPVSESPTSVYTNSIVVDGFASSNPNRLEYDETKRNLSVDDTEFTNTSNWLIEQANQLLSTTLFTDISLCAESSIASVTATSEIIMPSASIDLTANGVVAGQGAVLTWFDGPNGTGNNLGINNPITVSPAVTTTYYARLSGDCNTTETSILITVDGVQPTVEILNTPTNTNAAFTATFEFSEDVIDFVETDITVGNGNTSNFTTTDANTYTALITPIADGNVTIDVNADVATDNAGNNNTAATQTVTAVETTQPNVSISTTESSPTSINPIAVTITFSESVNGFEVSDISVTNATLNDFVGSGTTYTVNIEPTATGIVTLNISSDVASDIFGNGNKAATEFSISYDSTLSMEGISLLEKGISIYPNPSRTFLNIENKTNLELRQFDIYDIQGKMIKSQLINHKNDMINIDISGVDAGIYFLRINSLNESTVKKLIIQ